MTAYDEEGSVSLPDMLAAEWGWGDGQRNVEGPNTGKFSATVTRQCRRAERQGDRRPVCIGPARGSRQERLDKRVVLNAVFVPTSVWYVSELRVILYSALDERYSEGIFSGRVAPWGCGSGNGDTITFVTPDICIFDVWNTEVAASLYQWRRVHPQPTDTHMLDLVRRSFDDWCDGRVATKPYAEAYERSLQPAHRAERWLLNRARG